MEEELILNQYEEITCLNYNHIGKVKLIRDKETGVFYVCKEVNMMALPVLEALKAIPEKSATGFPIIHYIEKTDEGCLVIEDFIHGQTLDKILSKRLFAPEEALSVISSLCDCLQVLSRQQPPIVHRDIKPSNVMITTDGAVKLIDFDSARVFDPDQNTDTVKMGTIGFASPEQYGFRQTDVRSDIYSLGILLNYMITGKHPLEEKADPVIDRIVRKCTRIEPEHRFEDVRMLKKTLIKAKRFYAKKNNRWNLFFENFGSRFSFSQRKRISRWRVFLSLIGYIMLFYLCFNMKGNNSSGLIISLQLIILCSLLLFNFRKYRQFFIESDYEKVSVRVISCLFWGSVLFCVAFSLYNIVSSIISG